MCDNAILMPISEIFTIIIVRLLINSRLTDMKQQIVKVENDPKDQACLQITLRQMPERIKFWRKQHPQLITYKGYGRHWYCLPSFKPAPSKIVPLLKQISRGSQFRHLRVKLS